MVTQEIEKLKKLQLIIIDKIDIKKQINDIPKNILTKQELLQRIRQRNQTNAEALEKKQAEIIRLREELEHNEQEREKLESHMESVKTQREYEALEKEIREKSDRESAIRERQELLKNDVEQLKESIKHENEIIIEQEKELNVEEEQMKGQSDSLQKQLKKLETDESRLTKGFSDEFLFKFQRIISTMKGHGIVPLRSVICTGCHMILPNHTANEVRKEEKILFCPYCSKVLYFEETDQKQFADADMIESFDGSLNTEFSFDDIFKTPEAHETSETSDGDDEYIDDDDAASAEDEHVAIEGGDIEDEHDAEFDETVFHEDEEGDTAPIIIEEHDEGNFDFDEHDLSKQDN